jgi:predicted metal-dependent peptidase
MSNTGREVASVVAAICRSVVGGGSEGVRVISVDTTVHGDARVTSARDVSRLGLYSGGGGTDLRWGIARACEPRRGWRADVIVVVTDGDGIWPEEPPHIPVIVALVGGRYRSYVPPWARIVEVNREERR